jgi:hypothetical protein
MKEVFDVSDWPKYGSLSYNITLEWNISYGNGEREKDWGAGISVNSDSHHILFLRNLAYENDYGYLCDEGGGHLEYYHNVSMRNRDEVIILKENMHVIVIPVTVLWFSRITSPMTTTNNRRILIVKAAN